MPLTFQVESFDSWMRDVEPLIYPHWKELTLDKDICDDPWPDEAKFRQAEKEGTLLIVTARDDGKLAGYWVGALLPHLHYRNCGLMLHTDMYFLDQRYRVAANGIRLLQEVQRIGKGRGAVKFYISCKAHEDHTRIFEAMGMRKTDYVFTRRLA